MLIANNYQINKNHLIVQFSFLYVNIIHGCSAYHNFHAISNELMHI
jgi:hypothetical protein